MATTFFEHDKVVYPGLGVARINRIIEMHIGGIKTTCYELIFLQKEEDKVIVPTQTALAVGIRPLSSEESIADALSLLAMPARKISHYEFTASSWNKRHKEYQRKLLRGSLKEISEIYRDLRYIETQKELSFGEKNLLQQTELLLVEEISLVQRLDHEKTIERLRSICITAQKMRLMQQEQSI